MTPATLARLNAAGVVALAALGLVQWRDNVASRHAAAEEGARAVKAETALAATTAALAGAKADLEDFRGRLDRAGAALAESEKTLRRERRRAEDGERMVGELREAVTRWGDAVAARDRRLAEYEASLRETREAQAEAVRRHNALAARANETAARFSRLVEALGDEAAPVRLTREAIPTPVSIAEPGKPARKLTVAEAEALVRSLVGREGHAYPKPFDPKPGSPASLVAGEGLRLLIFNDGSARFERPDLRVHLPAPPPAP